MRVAAQAMLANLVSGGPRLGCRVRWRRNVTKVVCLALVALVAGGCNWVSLIQVVYLNHKATALYAQGRYAEAEALLKHTLSVCERAGEPPNVYIAILNNLAEVYIVQGRYAEAEPLLKRALSTREKTQGSEHPDVALAVNNLGGLYYAQGRYDKAEPLLRRALAIREKALGPQRPEVAESLNNLALLKETEGQYAEAEPLFKRALAIWEKTLGPEHPNVAFGLSNLAELYRTQGRYAEAEPLYRRALAIRQKKLGPEHPDTAATLNNLAMLYWSEARYTEAEPLFKRALAIWEKRLGPENPTVATCLNNLAEVYRAQGRYAEAEPLYRRSLAIREKTLGPEHPDVAKALGNLAQFYQSQGRYSDAEPLYRRSAAILEKSLGPEHPDTATSLNNLANLYHIERRDAEAEPLYKRALAIHEKALGPMHPDLTQNLNNLADLYCAQGRYPEARAFYERARRIALKIRDANQTLEESVLQSMLRNETVALYSYISLLATIVRAPKLDPSLTPSAALVLAFEVTEQARGSAAQTALVRAGLRAAAADPGSAELARRVEDLSRRRATVAAQLDTEYGKSSTGRESKNVGLLQLSLKNADDELATASEQLYKTFPNYRELGAPEPISMGETQKLLRPDEVLVKYFVLNDRVLIWVVRPGNGSAYRDSPVKWTDLAAAVLRIRASLSRDKPFDVIDSYQLYELLLQPFKNNLSGTEHLIVVPDFLLPVPFAALVMSDQGNSYAGLSQAYKAHVAPSPRDLERDYPGIAWLANDSRAISVLPSATSLRALRGLPRPTSPTQLAQTEPFIGIGDPLLTGKGEERGGSMFANDDRAGIDPLRKLPRLPGAREELIAEARTLHADPVAALFMEERATKPQVMRLNQKRLGNARVVSFATHALIGGEVKTLIAPALVLTPPAKPKKEDDGLLSLDDILGLKLTRNEWVILSACNTAAPDGSGEGLSGLARAFFYAGAPSLLVSQWSVDDTATQQLMTNVLGTYASTLEISRAQALRLGMHKLMMEQAKGRRAYFAHPYAWAPFFVVGEGGPVAH